jgi:cytochrome bd-type quinol oxidase subunit 2
VFDDVLLGLRVVGVCALLAAVVLTYRARSGELDERKRRWATYQLVVFSVAALGFTLSAVADLQDR